MSRKNLPAAIGVILVNEVSGQLYVLIQRRIRNVENPTHGMWEVPQGKIDSARGLVLSLERETQEETCMTLVGLHQETRLPQRFFSDAPIASSFRPFWCTEVLGDAPQLVLFVIGKCRGTPSITKEATDHRWVTSTELRTLLDEGSVCSMDHDVLRFWSENPVHPAPNNTVESHRKGPVLAVDCGGVLLRSADEVLEHNLASALGCSGKLVTDTLFKSGLRSELHRGDVLPSDVWAKLREVSKSNVSDSSLRDAWTESVSIISENIHWLSLMRSQFPEVLFVATTNIDPITEDMLMTSSDWVSHFDMWFSSWRMKVSKPSPLFFETVENLACSRECRHVFLIDDLRINRTSAAQAGWKTVEIASNQQLISFKIEEQIEKWLKTL